jgi:hypothetical protein
VPQVRAACRDRGGQGRVLGIDDEPGQLPGGEQVRELASGTGS